MTGASPGPAVRATTFASGGYAIDALLHEPPEVRGAAVVTHPHPAHGGHMDHPVVLAVAERAARAGLLVLRFDFRGVRRSEGDVGDIAGHVEDVRQACAAVRERAPEGPLLGAGFSYGARLLARAIDPRRDDPPRLSGLLLLAPATKVPRTARDFGNLLLGRPLDETARDAPAVEALRRIGVRARVLVGAHDVVAPVDELSSALPPSAALDVLPGLNHFFSRGRGASEIATDLLVPALDRALEALLAG